VPEVTVTTGKGFTVTVKVAVFMQLFASVAVIVYGQVITGLAVTAEPLVELNPVPGDHVYVFAPVTVNVVELPTQMVADAAVKVGNGFTVTVDVAVFTQLLISVPVIV
jgi:hypothetical protein